MAQRFPPAMRSSVKSLCMLAGLRTSVKPALRRTGGASILCQVGSGWRSASRGLGVGGITFIRSPPAGGRFPLAANRNDARVTGSWSQLCRLGRGVWGRATGLALRREVGGTEVGRFEMPRLVPIDWTFKAATGRTLVLPDGEWPWCLEACDTKASEGRGLGGQ